MQKSQKTKTHSTSSLPTFKGRLPFVFFYGENMFFWRHNLKENTSGLAKQLIHASLIQNFKIQEKYRLHNLPNPFAKHFWCGTKNQVLQSSYDMYHKPKNDMVDYLSALGLRHVGYGVPIELFGPFTDSCVQVMKLGFVKISLGKFLQG